MIKFIKTFLLIFLLALTISQFLLNVGNKPSIEIKDTIKINETKYSLKYVISAGDHNTQLNVVSFPAMSNFKKNTPIYIYYEYQYDQKKTWIPYNMITGLYYDLQYETRVSNLNTNVSLVDSEKLFDILTKGKPGILIVPLVTYNVELPPPKVKLDDINSWVKKGGVVIWLGANADILVKNLELKTSEPLITSKWPLRQATINTKISEGLNLSYGFVNLGVRTDVLSSINGQSLGKIYQGENENRTAIALVPYENGAVVIFGYGIFPPYWQMFVAKDIMRIVNSGILNLDGPVYYKSYMLTKNTFQEDNILLDSENFTRWNIFAYSNEEADGFPGKLTQVDLGKGKGQKDE